MVHQLALLKVYQQLSKKPLAEFIHCRSHCLNLAIVFACKNDVVSKFMDDLTSLCYFLQNWPKRQQYFETFNDYHKDQLSISDSNKKHVIGLAKTRWVERHKGYENYYILYRFVVATFESICSPTLYQKFYMELEEKHWSRYRNKQVGASVGVNIIIMYLLKIASHLSESNRSPCH